MGDTYDSAAEAETDRVQQKASRSTQVELEPIGLTEQGQRYRVTYAGETLVEGRRNPIFDACRALLARGITGRLEVWRRGKASADMQLDIERGAGLAICETATESVRVVPWQPYPDVTSQNATHSTCAAFLIVMPDCYECDVLCGRSRGLAMRYWRLRTQANSWHSARIPSQRIGGRTARATQGSHKVLPRFCSQQPLVSMRATCIQCEGRRA